MENLFEQFQVKRPRLIVKDQLWSWEEIEKLVEQKIQVFHELGLRKGDIVAASGSKIWLTLTWLSCLAGGYIFCPVPSSSKNLMEPPIHSLTQSSSSLLWFHENSPPLMTNNLFTEWAFLSKLRDPCALLKTSGTGDGKGRWIALEIDCVQSQIQAHADAFSLKGKTNQERLQALPIYHVFGLILDLSVGLALGQTIYLLEPPLLLSKSWIQLARAKTWDMALTPRLLHLLHRFYRGETLGKLHLGGARVSNKLIQHARELFSSCVEGYGLTECGPGVLWDGLPIGCQVKLDFLGDDKSPLGLLKVKSKSMGFWATKDQDIQNDWYNTKDLVSFQGGRYQIVGRLGRSIKHLDGRWVWLDQLESEWENLLGLYALRMDMQTNGYLQIRVLEEDAHFVPELEKLVSKGFDLPIDWQLISLQKVMLTPDKAIFNSITPRNLLLVGAHR